MLRSSSTRERGGRRAPPDPPALPALTDPFRLAALRREGLLAAPPVEDFDRLTRVAAELLAVPIALVTFVDADRQVLASRVAAGTPLDGTRELPLSHSICKYVVAGEAPLVLPDTRSVPWLRDSGAVTDLRMIAYAGFPLFARDGSPIGVFSVSAAKPRTWTRREQAAVRDFAGLAQSALDLRTARDDALEISAILARLRGLTDAMNTERGVAVLLDDLVAACVSAFHADVAVIELLDREGKVARRAAHGLEGGDPGRPVRAGAGFSSLSPTAYQTIAIADLPALDPSGPLIDSGVRSVLAAPLIVDDRVHGVIHVGARSPRVYGEPDRHLLAAAAERFVAAITRAEAHGRERHATRTLIAALRPEQLPGVPGVRLVAHYEPAERGLGGDWYDAFTLPGDGLGVAIGDVVGHGIEAAAEAVRLRHALRGCVLSGRSPAECLSQLNRYAAREPGAYASTLVYMELDAVTRRLRWAIAGHPPALLTEAGRTRRLSLAGGPPLGVMAMGTWPSGERTLAPGARLVLFTDGLVERRGEDLDAGIDRVARAAASAPDLERLCAAALAHAPVPRFDDLALLALELEPAAATG